MVSIHDLGGIALTGRGGKATLPIGQIIVGLFQGIETEVPEGSYPGPIISGLDTDKYVLLPNHKLIMDAVEKVEVGAVLALNYLGKSGSGKYDRYEIAEIDPDSLDNLRKTPATNEIFTRSTLWFNSTGEDFGG